MFERATRLCVTSPTIATFSPSRCPFFSRIVRRSRSAWVGCSWAPSPALTTAHFRCRASIAGAPEALWRTTTTSGHIASMFFAVSSRLSPFSALLPDDEKLITSAESHLPAISNEVRVRVEASKKRFTTVLPRRVGTFLISRVAISFMDSAVSSTSVISEGSRSCMPRRSLRFHVIRLASFGDSPRHAPRLRLVGRVSARTSFRRFLDDHAVDPVVLPEHDGDSFATARRQVLSDVVGPDGQLPVTAVHEHGQADDARAAQIHQRVHRGTDRPAGEEHVVHQD